MTDNGQTTARGEALGVIVCRLDELRQLAASQGLELIGYLLDVAFNESCDASVYPLTAKKPRASVQHHHGPPWAPGGGELESRLEEGMRKIVAGKLHGIHVTEANLDYHGSITLDPDHCEQAGILPMEFVEIWNKNSGARISTYVILGERGSRCCILNGAAARTCQPGDQVIICNSVYVDQAELTALKPRVLTFDKDNRIVDRLTYSVERDAGGGYSFSILDEARTPLPVPALVGRS